ncbi:MAG: HAD-IA family hydrolase [Methylophilaceae bacterium]
MPKQFDLIVWDWDGTLADSTGMITQAILSAAEQVGLPAVSMQTARNIIGLGLKEAIHSLYGELPPEVSHKLASQYTANYYAGEGEIPLFEGATETIIALSQLGYKQAIATGKSRRGLNLAIEHAGIGQYLQATRTVDECFSKPHPQMLNELMDHLVVMPERALMIGDTSYDLQMAKNAGIQSIGVGYGAHTAEQWQHLAPIQEFNDFSSLSHWLLNYA